MQSFKELTATLVVIGVVAWGRPTDAATTCAPASKTAKQAAAKAYRARFPFLMQGVARMQSSPGCTILVIGEPPPHVTIPDLLAEIDAAEPAEDVLVVQNSFGEDGWTRDLVLTIDSTTSEQAVNTISLAHRYLFGTSFRAWTIDLDAPPPSSGSASLSLGVTAADLKAWAIDSNTAFTPVLGGATRSGSQLLHDAPVGVYEAERVPLIAWVLETKIGLDARDLEIRQFAMAADLVLGAFISETRVVAIGRARSAPFEVLPPLRTETIQLLADAKDTLAQSYERMSPLAGVDGPVSRTIKSWAPIYLSPELIDSEYGSLLNLADQLLKSWSNAGQTRYTNFPYPDPKRWPFGDKTVLEQVGGSSITYNWNTNGFASAFVGDRFAIFSFASTGALPLDYFPPSAETSASKSASATGRSYFANVGDPHLVRVVQYAGLYHIFQAAKLVDDRPPSRAPTARPSDKRAQFLEDAANAMLTAYASVSEAKLRELADRDFDAEAPAHWPRTPRARAVWGDIHVANHHQSLLAGASESRLRSIAKLWVSPPASPTAAQRRDIDACVEARSSMHELVDIAKLRKDYRALYPAPRAPWLHTATSVTSTNGMMEGGHNLDFALHQVERLPPPTKWQTTLRSSGPAAVDVGAGGWRSVPAGASSTVLEGYRGSSAVRVVRVERAADHYVVSFEGRKQSFKSWTQADATDAIANIAKTQENQTQPLRIHVENLSVAEARNFRTQAERAVNRGGGKQQVEVVVFEHAVDAKAARLAGTPRPLGELKLHPALIVDEHTVEVAITEARGLKALFLKIKVIFRTKVVEPVRARVAELVERTMRALGKTGSRNDVSTMLNRELAARLKAEGLDATIEIVNEAGHTVVVELEAPLARAGT